jgi:hypothetical protein
VPDEEDQNHRLSTDGRVNNWCRRLTLTQARECRGLHPPEQLLHKDIARVRYLMEATFGMLFGTDDRTDMRSTKMNVDRQPENIAEHLLSGDC